MTPDNWVREAARDWVDAYPGTVISHAILGRHLKAFVMQHGWLTVRPAWQAYLKRTESRFASALRFTQTCQLGAKVEKSGMQTYFTDADLK